MQSSLADPPAAALLRRFLDCRPHLFRVDREDVEPAEGAAAVLRYKRELLQVGKGCCTVLCLLRRCLLPLPPLWCLAPSRDARCAPAQHYMCACIASSATQPPRCKRMQRLPIFQIAVFGQPPAAGAGDTWTAGGGDAAAFQLAPPSGRRGGRLQSKCCMCFVSNGRLCGCGRQEMCPELGRTVCATVPNLPAQGLTFLSRLLHPHTTGRSPFCA